MRIRMFAVGFVLLLSSCIRVPTGPSVAVMPAPGKPFDLFVYEESLCRYFAEQQSGVSPQESADESMLTSAAAGTALGAAAGTAMGAAVGHIGPGAVIGAGAGLMGGTAAGANAGYYSAWGLQQRYDIAYQQCMYAKGNQLPGFPVAAIAPPPPPPPY